MNLSWFKDCLIFHISKDQRKEGSGREKRQGAAIPDKSLGSRMWDARDREKTDDLLSKKGQKGGQGEAFERRAVKDSLKLVIDILVNWREDSKAIILSGLPATSKNGIWGPFLIEKKVV